MLSFRALVRFALSGSPTRERREILFSAPKKKDHEKEPQASDQREASSHAREQSEASPPSPPPQEQTAEAAHDAQARTRETKRTLDEFGLVEHETRDTSAQVSSILRVLDSQEIFDRMGEATKSQEIFDRLSMFDETAGGLDLLSIATQAGIALTMSEQDTPLPQGSPREVLRAIIDYDTEHGLPVSMKRTFIEMLLRASPGMTAVFARSLLTRIREYEGAHTAIEASRTHLHKNHLLGKDGDAGIALAARIGSPEIPTASDAVDLLAQKSPLTHEQHTELLTTLTSAHDALQKSHDFGNRYWGDPKAVLPPEEDERRKLTYLKHLKEQARDILRLLNIQLRTGAQELVQRIDQGAQAILKSPKSKGLERTITKSADAYGKRALKLLAWADDPKNDLPQDPNHPNFLTLTEEFLREEDRQLSMLASIREDTNRLLARWKEGKLTEEQREQGEDREWATRCLTMLDAVLTDPTLTPDTQVSLERLQAQLHDPEVSSAFSEEERAREEYVLQTLLERGETTFIEATREGNDLAQSVSRELTETDAAAWIGKSKRELKQMEDGLAALLTHPVCTTLGVTNLVHAYAKDLSDGLDLLAETRIDDGKKKDMCERIGVQLRHWRSALALVRKLEQSTSSDIPPEGNDCVEVLSREEYLRRFRVETSRSCYGRGKIYIRGDVPREEWPELVKHEKAHFLLSILTEQSHLFPDLFEKVFAEQTSETDALLEKQAQGWGVRREIIEQQYREENPNLPEPLLQQRVNVRYHRDLLEETAVRGALAAPGSRDGQIFAQLQQKEGIPTAPTYEGETFRHSTEDELTPDFDTEAATQAPQTGSAYDAKEDLEEIQHMIKGIQTFGESYGTPAAGRHYNSRFKQEADQVVGNGNGDGGYQDILNELEHIWFTGTMRNKTVIPDPQYNKVYIDFVGEVKQRVKTTHEKVEELDKMFAEINQEPATRKKKISEKLGIRWLCVLDMIRIWKELKEDITGIWTSKQDQVTADAKAALYKSMPSKIPGTNIDIPIVGKYTERLPHYAERRRNQLELERVKKWEDAFTNLDAEELLKLIGEDPTRDQLRASIELLVKKGRMKWADHRVWKALNKFSHYRMPEAPCDRDETLRDKWLQKLISDIWLDKDMFNEWMTGNNGNFDKHKQSYTHEADNFANLAGKTAYELHVMLRTFVECTEKHLPLPEDVNPHHFEELLHYSMRMGKMSMEQKVFFLIQGIACGFLPVERLRALGGEKGGVLLKFPFLDYFYQRHNSLSEIKAISKRLTEYEDGKPTFLPGPKSTMFMRIVLLRDQKALERISKALDKGAEGLDHEDIPYLATEIDWVKMLSLLGVMSGARSKVSKEGWKNAYVGFNEKFKVYANLAHLAKEKKAVMTDGDVRNLAQSIGAYIVMDNQMMRATDLKAGQISLSDEALNIERTVANPALRTADFRNRTRDFIWELAHAVGMQDSDLNVPGITMEQFLSNRNRDNQPVSPDLISKLDKAREPFIHAFTEKIAARPDKLIEVLTAFEGGSFAAGRQFLDSQTKEDGTSKLNYQTFSERYQAIIGQQKEREPQLVTAP